MNNHKQNGSFFAGKGYYIALILCTVVIGITGYVYYRNSARTETAAQAEPQSQQVASVEEEQEQEDIPALATRPSRQTPAAPAETQPAAAQPPQTQPTKPLSTTSPVAGQEVAGYSMEALCYNQTTRDWRVHDGVDLAAEEGTPVCAAADGVVESIREDDAMGYTVVIRHDGGYVTRYASLAPEISVESGEAVHMGQVIGCVGSTALVETALGPHVHFSVSYREKPMDPGEFLALGK